MVAEGDTRRDGGLVLPPKPEPPIKGECCGRGCEHCVWVYYYRALDRWEQHSAAARMRQESKA